jgi:hypothetical protein
MRATWATRGVFRALDRAWKDGSAVHPAARAYLEDGPLELQPHAIRPICDGEIGIEKIETSLLVQQFDLGAMAGTQCQAGRRARSKLLRRPDHCRIAARRTNRQAIARPQCPALVATKSGRQVGRRRSEHFGNVNASSERHIVPGPCPGRTDLEFIAFADYERAMQLDALTVNPRLRLRPANGDVCTLIECKRDACQGRFKRRRQQRITDELVCQCQ